jgi:nucleoside transporter
MFLEFATWGAWLPILGIHLTQIGFTPKQIGLVTGTGALAGMFAPLIAGQIADRWMATEIFLALSHLTSAVFFFIAASATGFWEVFSYSFAAMFFYTPTMGLSNSLTMRHLKDPKAAFPVVRSFGTIGWIAAGLGMTVWLHLNPGRPVGDCLRAGALCAFVQGVFSFFLPPTPPVRETKKKFAVGEAFAMLREPSYAVFIGLSFLLMFVMNFYYGFAGKFFQEGLKIPAADVSSYLSIGQFVEIFTLMALPFIYKKLGAKKTVMMGLAFLALRFGAYVLGGPLWMVVASQALHGMIFAFTFVVAMIYVDKIAPADARASAQSFLAFVTYGAGMVVGSVICAQFAKMYTRPDNSLDFQGFFMVPFLGSIAILVIFMLLFHPKETESSSH